MFSWFFNNVRPKSLTEVQVDNLVLIYALNPEWQTSYDHNTIVNLVLFTLGKFAFVAIITEAWKEPLWELLEVICRQQDERFSVMSNDVIGIK